MDSHDFIDSEFGRPSRSVESKLGYTVYLPRALPRSIRLEDATSVVLSNADRALGRLAGSGRLLRNPLMLTNLYLRREAVASTRIEGTRATLDDLLEAETGGSLTADIQEVINYVRALYEGIEAIRHGPITIELVCQLHVTLMAGVRGEDKRPGQVGDRPNWIGSSDPVTARFVPPPQSEVSWLLADWESFVSEDFPMPPLIRCATMHYQFETIHPFFDGNGRLGRLLITLYLLREDHLPAPLLYLSTYFEHNKRAYYDALQGVRERGDIQTWLQYFLAAVIAQANDAVRRSERLLDLAEDYRRRLTGTRSRAHELVDTLLATPWVSTQSARTALGVTGAGATNILRQLEQVGILRPAPRIPGRSNRWVAFEVLEVIRDDFEPELTDGEIA